MSTFEATAPVRIDLAGRTLDIWPLYLFHPGAVSIAVAIDRRVACRVTTGVNGLVLESKDSLVKAEGRDLSEVFAKGSLPLAACALRALGVEAGIHVVTQARVPENTGLGVSSALATAVVAAVAKAVGRSLAPDELWAIARDAEAQAAGMPSGALDPHVALLGGVVEVRTAAGRVGGRRLATDPSRVEEHLLLVDSGAGRVASTTDWSVLKRQIDGDDAARQALARIASAAQRVRAALVDQRYPDVTALMREEWEARKTLAPAVTSVEIDRIGEIAAAAGGAAKACGTGGGGMVAVWIEPAARERATAAFREAGFKAYPVRVDLQGLSVEAG